MQLAAKAATLARRMSLKTPWTNGIPGKDWLSGFQKRHKDFSACSPVALSTVRARMMNPSVVGNYFNELGSIIKNEKPKKVWNMDETSVPMLHKPVKILAKTGSKNIPGRVGNCRDNVTVLACIGTDGTDIPPLCIVKGKTTVTKLYQLTMWLRDLQVQPTHTRLMLGWRMF